MHNGLSQCGSDYMRPKLTKKASQTSNISPLVLYLVRGVYTLLWENERAWMAARRRCNAKDGGGVWEVKMGGRYVGFLYGFPENVKW